MPVLTSVTESLFTFAWHLVREGGLPAIFVLMLAESACIPIPSEATMMFAGFAVADPGGSHAAHHLTIVSVIVVGVLGNLVGSWIAYALGRAGRLQLIERHGRRLHIKPSHIAWADRWFARFGAPAVFFSRMLPILRTFISLPAGVAKMPFWRFTALTIAGSVPWVAGLAIAGNAVGSNWESVRGAFTYSDYAVIVIVLAAIVWAIVRALREGGDASGGGSEGGASGPSRRGSSRPASRSRHRAGGLSRRSRLGGGRPSLQPPIWVPASAGAGR